MQSKSWNCCGHRLISKSAKVARTFIFKSAFINSILLDTSIQSVLHSTETDDKIKFFKTVYGSTFLEALLEAKPYASA